MVTTSRTTVTFTATASTTPAYVVVLRQALPPQRFVCRRIKREYREDWRAAVRGAYDEIMGDAPPKRLQKERRAWMLALRRVLREMELSAAVRPPEQA